MINCETAIQYVNYSETQSLKQQILSQKKITDCVYLISGDVCVIAVITEPIYFMSELRRLTSEIAQMASEKTDAENIYVTRDTDIYCDINKVGKLKNENEKAELIRKIINKVTKRAAYEND